MRIRKIHICNLQSEQDPDVHDFVASIKNHGFAILNTDGVEEQSAMLRTLQEAEQMRTFRFPSHSEDPHYTEDQRASFKGLFQWGQICLRTLLNHLDPDGTQSAKLHRTLDGAQDMDILFPPHGLGHTPFPEGVDFSGSFFNIFNYDYGLLNHHKDRYLVTVVTVHQPSDVEGRTVLWANSPTLGWVNIDAHMAPGDVAIFTGEDFEVLSESLGARQEAVLHCTRVDPTGDRLPKYDDQPDPSTPPTGNRISMAFVLSDAVNEDDED